VSILRRLRHGLTLSALGLLLVACGQGQATATPNRTAAGVGCFQSLQIAPTTASPTITASQAEVAARAAHDTPAQAQSGKLDALQDARLVTVLASGVRANGQDSLRGQEVWLLVFAYLPADQPATLPAGNGGTLRWTTYALVGASGGGLLASCTSPL